MTIWTGTPLLFWLKRRRFRPKWRMAEGGIFFSRKKKIFLKPSARSATTPPHRHFWAFSSATFLSGSGKFPKWRGELFKLYAFSHFMLAQSGKGSKKTQWRMKKPLRHWVRHWQGTRSERGCYPRSAIWFSIKVIFPYLSLPWGPWGGIARSRRRSPQWDPGRWESGRWERTPRVGAPW